MLIGIVGGILQGMEAVYLCKHAGYTSMVIDKRKDAPALSLADRAEVCDILQEPERAKALFSECDAVIPAVENLEVLEFLSKTVPECGTPLLFDMESYKISCSKEKSNELMARIGTPIPQPWPECGFPIIVKPSCQSGSIGVSAVNNEEERQRALKVIEKLGDTPIQQEFVSGKSVSIEVIGNGSTAKAYVTTEVVLDSNYDCKQIICEPRVLPEADEEQFIKIGKELGEGLGLNALMDVEAIFTKKGLRVLEIDARIPSQTPACICAATGINLLEELVCSKLGKETGKVPRKGYASYEHFIVRGTTLSTCGKKEFSHVQNPMYLEDFMGADEVITDYRSGTYECRFTVINHGDSYQDVVHKKKQFITSIMENLELEEFVDKSPDMI